MLKATKELCILLNCCKNNIMKYEEEVNMNDVERFGAMPQVAVLDLGKDNIGKLGPNGLPEEKRDFHVAYDDPEMRMEGLTDTYICMDGRFEAGPESQVLGGLPLLDVSTDMMVNPSKTKLSVLVANKTKEAIADGFDVTVHGDSKAKKNGCAANFAKRDVLHFNAEHIDTIAPLTWTIARKLGLDTYVTSDDVTRVILDGKEAADDDDLWDVDAEQCVDIIVENGGRYIEAPGAHGEVDADFEMDDDSKIDTGLFGEAFTHEDGEAAQLFVVTLGKYTKDTFRRAEMHGRTKQEAALTVLAGISLHLAAFKILGSPEMGASLSGKPYVPADH